MRSEIKAAAQSNRNQLDYPVSQLPRLPDAALNLRCSYGTLAKADDEGGSDKIGFPISSLSDRAVPVPPSPGGLTLVPLSLIELSINWPERQALFP
jgi:hypothetical protein